MTNLKVNSLWGEINLCIQNSKGKYEINLCLCILKDWQILTALNAAAFHGFKSFTIFMIWPRSIYQPLLLLMVHLDKWKEEGKRSTPILSMIFIKLVAFMVHLGGNSAFCQMRMTALKENLSKEEWNEVCNHKKLGMGVKAQYKGYVSGKVMHNSAEQRLCIRKIDDLTPFITRPGKRYESWRLMMIEILSRLFCLKDMYHIR